MSKKIITILGATGIQGGSVVSTFANEPDWHVRSVTRNPSSSRAKSLQSKYPDIEIVSGDTNDVGSLKRAFAGSTAIFAVTNYWAPFSDEELQKQHATGPNPGEAMRRWAFDDEIQHGKNIADAAAAQVGKGLERFIWSGLPSIKKYSKGKYQHIYHFDSKEVITEYIHEKHPELAAKMSMIWVGFYASNIHVSPLMTPIKRSDGTFLVQRLCPAEAAHPFALTHQDTGPFVRALILNSEPGKTLLAYTAMISWAEMSRLWARALNVPTPEYREATLEDFKKQFPIAGEELQSATYSAEFGYAGRDPNVMEPKDLGFRDRPEDIERWFHEQDWTAVLNAEPRDV